MISTTPRINVKRFSRFTEIEPSLSQKITAAREQYLFPVEGNKLSDYRNSDARSIHFVAGYNNQLAGYVQYDPKLNRLRQMLVLPDFQGIGIGKNLVDEVVAEAKEHANKELLVNAWAASQGFYTKTGFVPYGAPYESNCIMCQKMRRLCN